MADSVETTNLNSPAGAQAPQPPEQPGNPQKPALWRGIVAVLLAAVGFVAAQVGAVQVFMLLYPIIGDLLADIVYVAVQIALFTLFIYLAGRVEKRSLAFYGLRVQAAVWPKLALGLGVGVAAFLLVVGPLYLTGQYQLGTGYGGWRMVLVGIIEFTAVGYMEELLCRGFLQHRMLRRMGPVWALVATALIFAALHLFNPEFSFIAFLNIFLAGTFMGAVMYATGSLFAAVGVHITWNWVQGSVLGIPVSGGEVYGLFSTTITGGSTLVTGGYFGAEASIVCTVVLAAATVGLLWLAKRNGNLQGFDYRTKKAATAKGGAAQ